MNLESLTSEAITLLKSLIETKSFSSEEDQTALLLELWFQKFNITYQRTQNIMRSTGGINSNLKK